MGNKPQEHTPTHAHIQSQTWIIVRARTLMTIWYRNYNNHSNNNTFCHSPDGYLMPAIII